MLTEILFYSTAFVILFISVFWLLIFFSTEPRKKRRLSSYPSLSIIIPAYNEESKIARCINSLIKQNYPELRIVIVDDGSTDNTQNISKEFSLKHKNIRYVRKKNAGKASALNFGLKYVNTEFFGFIDSDTYLSDNALLNMMTYFRKDVGAVTVAIKPDSAKNTIERMQRVEYLISSFTRKLMTYINVLYFTPAFAIYRTGDIKRLGGFDENNLTEDMEIGLRLKDNGLNIENSVEDSAYTDIPRNFNSLFHQRIRWYRGYIHNTRKYSKMMFSRKYGDLGIMVLPVQYIILALIIPFLLYSLYETSLFVFRKIMDLYITGFDLNYMHYSFSFNLISPTTFFLIVSFLSFFIMLKISKNNVKENIGKLDYIIYLLIYPFINVMLWIAAFIYEIGGVKKKW